MVRGTIGSRVRRMNQLADWLKGELHVVDTYDEDQSFLSRLLKKIPGFGGYVDQESRQKNDEQAREFLAAKLETVKTNIDSFAKALVDQMRLDDVGKCEKIRDQADTLIQHLRSRLPGYSSFFGSPKIDDNRLEEIYDADANLMDEAEDLARMSNGISSDQNLATIQTQLDRIQSMVREREKLIEGL